MKFQDSAIILQDLADAFGKRLTEAEIKSWHRRVFINMAPDVAVRAVDRIITQPSGDGKAKFFPHISDFLEVARSMKSAGSGPRLVEFEPGVWLPLDEVMAAQAEDKRWWDQYQVTPEDQAANVARLRDVIASSLGGRR